MDQEPSGSHGRKRSRSRALRGSSTTTGASHSLAKHTGSSTCTGSPPYIDKRQIKPADPVCMLIDVLPNDLTEVIVSCVQSKQGRDTLALTCKKLRAMGSSLRHCLRFDYNMQTDNSALSSTHAESDDAQANHHESRCVVPDTGVDDDDDHGSDVDMPWCTHHRKWTKLPQHLLQAIRAYPVILSITLRGCDRNKATDLPIVDLSSVFVPPNFKDLTTLQISALDCINDNFMAELSQCCHNLDHLDLKHCRFLTDAALASLATHCQQLTFLKIHCIRDTLSDNGVANLLVHCRHMTTLSLKGCTFVEGRGFAPGRALTRLEAVECTGITWEALPTGLKGLTALRALSLTYIDLNQDLGIPVAQHCQGIQELDLEESYGLRNRGIRFLMVSCPHLRVLRVNFCVSVNVRGWCAVAQHGVRLEELEVRGCKKFCAESLRAVQNGCPSLRFLKLANTFLPPNPAFLQFVQARPNVDVKVYDDKKTFGRLVYPTATQPATERDLQRC